jgi:hypothetical protein
VTQVVSVDPLRALGGTRRAYVIPDLKVLYISVAKNACTSVKWVIAGLAGEDPAQFAPRGGPFVNEFEGIHVRLRWERTPTLNQLEPGVRAQISPANGWFVFGIVRDPRARLFSAWQNKLLLRNPYYARWRDAPWFPQVPGSPDDVARDFATFVDLLYTSPAAKVADDAHFQPQSSLLRTDIVPYTRLYDISELDQMVSDVRDHVRALGWQGEVVLPNNNDTPLRATAAMFAGGVRERIEELHAEDFEQFGHRWDFGKIERTPEWAPEALTDVRARIAASERITELLGLVDQAKQRSRRQRQRVRTLQRRVSHLRQENDMVAARVPAWRRAARLARSAVRRAGRRT